MSYITKENFKQEIRDKIIDLKPNEVDDYVEAFIEVMELELSKIGWYGDC